MSLAKSGGAEVLIEGSLNVRGGRNELRMKGSILKMVRDDTRSIATAMPHSLERVGEEDENDLDSDHKQSAKSVRPLEDDTLSETSPFTSSASDER